MTTQTVVIIDDDRAIHEQVSVVLSKAGYRVVSAFSGKEGIALAASEIPSLVILDLCMPEMDGMETYRRLRAQPEQGCSCPVVMLTATNHSNNEVREIIDSGVSVYLEKPFGGRELLNVLRNVMLTHDIERKAKGQTGPCSMFDDSRKKVR